MEAEALLQCSQEPISGPNPEQDDSCPHRHTTSCFQKYCHCSLKSALAD
jgi:hypothetical protein